MLPKISILIVCYNQDKYITKAIESILSQKCKYSYEIIVQDDCSNDHTWDKILALRDESPKLIKAQRNRINVGIMPNYVLALNRCKGKYIAVLDGDDYWISEYKLQKQVSFLENNKDYSISSHNVYVLQETKANQHEWLGKNHRQDSSIEDVLTYGSGGATSSLVFKKSSLFPLPKWFDKLQSGDWTTQVLCCSKGKMHYFSQVMGVYRRNTGGATTFGKGSDKELKAFTVGGEDICSQLNSHFQFKFDKEIGRNLVAYFYPQIINAYLNRKDKLMATRYFVKLIKGMIKYQVSPDGLFKILLNLFCK